MKNQVIDYIGTIYDGGCYEPVTGICWKDGLPHQLFIFERDIEYYGKCLRVVYIKKSIYDPADLSAVDYEEDVYFDCWEI